MLKSYAKINLFLNVLNKRVDGYHNLETLFLTVSLADNFFFQQIEKKNFFSLECKPLIQGINLVEKAYLLIKKYLFPFSEGLHLNIKKNIPCGSGLAGGSSNAAMALLFFNKFYKLNLSKKKLMEISLQLGADVPFFIKGGLARGEGLGNKLEFFELNSIIYFVIVYPNIHISTKEAYKNLNLTNKSKILNINNLIYSLKNKDISFLKDNLYNSFEFFQFKKYPLLGKLKKKLINLGALGALMSGSGSSIFGVFDSEKKAKFVWEILKKESYSVFFVKNVKSFYKN